MKDLITIRIYFKHGQKVQNLSFWKRLNFDFSNELIKKAKLYDLNQVLNFSISKGYLEKGKINWEHGEVKHLGHPQIIEITDYKENIQNFLEQEKSFFEDAKVLMVKNEVLLMTI